MSKTQKRILELTKNGFQTHIDLMSATNLSHAGVHKALKALIERGHIRSTTSGYISTKRAVIAV